MPLPNDFEPTNREERIMFSILEELAELRKAIQNAVEVAREHNKPAPAASAQAKGKK